jgi:hypothetical protein
MSWLHSSLCCIPIEWDGKGKTSFGGPFHAKGCSMLASFIGSLHVMMVFFFFERVFGRPRFL